MSRGWGHNPTPTFDEWVRIIFDDPASMPEWFRDDEPTWNESANAATALAYMTRLFRDPWPLLKQFAPDRIGRGLYYLASNGQSNYGVVFLHPSVPLAARTDGLLAIADLYAKLFSRVCSWKLTTTSDQGPWSEAQNICYMWWDVFPMFARTRHAEASVQAEVRNHWEEHLAIEAACLRTMELTLQVDHPACQEGALHGLGHWTLDYPEVTQPIIDRFLASDRPIIDAIRRYATQARSGYIQ